MPKPSFFFLPHPNRCAGLMIACMAVASVVSSGRAHAFDLTPDASRVLTDPAYLPVQGQVYGTTAYTRGRTMADTDNGAGVQTRSYATESNAATQTAAYGITDDITVRAIEAYNWNRTQSDFSTGTNSKTDSNGFTDPSVGATWRFLDQRQYPISWDLIGLYSPDVFKDEGASVDNHGTVARGGMAADIGTAVSYKTKDFTVYTDGSANYLGSHNALASTGTTTETGSSWQYALGVTTQTRFLHDLLAFNAGVTETFNNSTSASNESTLLGRSNDPGDVTSFDTALYYQIVPDVLAAGVTYTNNLTADTDVTYPMRPASNTTTKNQDENVFGARLLYAFK